MTAQSLAPDEFAAFFEAIHGLPPFPWQLRLLRQVAESGRWPEVLDLPTGSGKTAALDIAVFHLALEASRGAGRRAPVRIAFVVDRRLIVDDAFERAKRLEQKMAQAASDESGPEVLRTVAAQLARFAERENRPLLARRLRGGMPREDDWARTPSQPTILCSTVDQVGSRLLFRGYGISDSMKPVHAGLLGADCLILLDEAHLAEPFRQTLGAVKRLRGGDDAPWHVATLTATPGAQSGTVEFRLDGADRDHPVLSRRLRAQKPSRLIEIPGRQGVSVESRRIDEITERALEAVRELRQTIATPAVGVVVNRVARARGVFTQLKERLRDELSDADVVLLIGPARQAERGDLIDELTPIRTGSGAPRQLARPLIVVATQTIEAGVDIDFDGLLTEAAPLDALRQRFGRLNRAGREISPVSVILANREDFAAKADDPVYGDRIAATWNTLVAAAGATDGAVNFGIEAFPSELSDAAAKLVAPKPRAPILMPAYVDLWSQTSPVPAADPDVALFLHGPDRSPASIQVVWRADIREADLIDGHGTSEAILEVLRLMPPRPGEAIEIPVWAIRAWLWGQSQSLAALSDAPERAPEEVSGGPGKPVFRYAGAGSERSQVIRPADIRPGDLIVVPATYGGCDHWGWNPGSKDPVRDLAEIAAAPYHGRRYAVRVTPELIHQWSGDTAASDSGEPISDLDQIEARLRLAIAEHRDDGDPRAVMDAIFRFSLPDGLQDLLGPLREGKYNRPLARPFFYMDPASEPWGVIFVAPFGLTERGKEDESVAPPATESDDVGLPIGRVLLLAEHSRDVCGYAGEFGHKAGLPPDIAGDVALAGYLHDAGKADPRFQAMLYGGDWLAVDESRILAKSVDPIGIEAWTRAGLPDRWRHEALSVRIACKHPRFREANDPELVLWLIGVHHGYGRPLFPHSDAWDGRDRDDLVAIEGPKLSLKAGPGPQSLVFSFDGWDWPQLFDCLKRRYGVWELARLEAIVRLADHRASEAAAQGSAGSSPT